MPKQLTDPGCRAEKSGPARREIANLLLPGLYFVIEQTPKSGRDKDAGRSWAARYRSPLNGKPAKFRLGPFPTVGLSKARDLCRDALRHVAAGRDPRNVKADAIAAEVETKRPPKSKPETQSTPHGPNTTNATLSASADRARGRASNKTRCIGFRSWGRRRFAP